MAEFKTLRGPESNLNNSTTPLTDGCVYFCTDTQNVFIDYTDGTGNVVRGKINSKYADGLKYLKDGNTLELTAEDINTLVSNHATDTSIHITDAERETWNAKANTDVATETSNGLMSGEDKTKLNTRSTFYNVSVNIPASSEVVRTLAVEGMTANDIPFVGVSCTPDNYEAERAEWKKVYDAVAIDGGITIYLTEPITTTITMYCVVFRI